MDSTTGHTHVLYAREFGPQRHACVTNACCCVHIARHSRDSCSPVWQRDECVRSVALQGLASDAARPCSCAALCRADVPHCIFGVAVGDAQLAL